MPPSTLPSLPSLPPLSSLSSLSSLPSLPSLSSLPSLPSLPSLLTLSSLSLLLACQSPEATENRPPVESAVQRFDPRMEVLLPPGVQVERLAAGFDWSEGPLWLPDHNRLIFSDVPRNRIYQYIPGDSTATVWLQPSGYTADRAAEGESGSNGLALDPQGRLLLCQHGDRRVARMRAPLDDPRPAFETLAASYQGQRFNSPNDLCVHRSGAIFFTDPPYGLPGGPDDPSRELDIQGVYRRDPDGSVTLLIDSLSRPNGIALSPDQRTLYVANSDPQAALWMAYALDEAGGLIGGQLLYDATQDVGESQPGLPDGLKVDAKGYIWATGPGGVWMFAPEGKLLGRILTGLPTSNCALAPGYLYLTADSLLLRVRRLQGRGASD